METKTKVALVTGGNRGLGKNMVLRLAGKGNDVILTYNSNKAEADSVVAEVRAMGRKAEAYQLDTTNTQSFDAFLKNVSEHLEAHTGSGKFDFLVNNAGTSSHNGVAEVTVEELDVMYKIHLKGVFMLTVKALPYLNDNGRIVNISTGLARFSTPGFAAYAAMKGAVEVFTRYLAKELGSRGITANAVAPGLTETDFTRVFLPGHEEGMKQVGSMFALGRVGKPEDIGGVVAFLCTEDARWITAQRIEVSGGQLL
ncbi:MAG: SDR family oxidoreductase [Bacteroidetes bacterium]|nr:SDR family oxidoreductase [Bacteroidota bacterium]